MENFYSSWSVLHISIKNILSSRGVTGRSRSLSTQGRGIDLHVKIRRGEGAHIKLCQETRGSSRVRLVCRGTFWVASRVSSTVLNFKSDHGISRDAGVGKGLTLWWWGNLVVFLELWRDSRVMTGNSGNLSCCPCEVQSPFELRGGAGDCSWFTAGQIDLI